MIKVGQLALGLALQTSYFGCLWSKIVNELLIGKKMGYVSHKGRYVLLFYVQNFSLWLKSPKKVPNNYPEHYLHKRS